MYLDVRVALAAATEPLDTLAEQICASSATVGVDLRLTGADLGAWLRTFRPGRWATLVSGTAPAPPVDGWVELLVPVVTTGSSDETEETDSRSLGRALLGPRCAARSGTALARIIPGRAGSPGYDLLGRTVAPRLLVDVQLPQGRNTVTSPDATTLLAACDGEVHARRHLIDVLPMRVWDGDIGPADSPVAAENGLFVIGSITSARVAAAGDIYVTGDVFESGVTSEGATVAVAGSVNGSERRVSTVCANSHIACGSIRLAEIRAGGDIHIKDDARQSRLIADGSVYVQSIDKCLIDVQLRLGGGLVPAQELVRRLAGLPPDRQHFRIALAREASLAIYGQAPPVFESCTIVDLSTSGARCRVAGPELRPGAIVQLKFDLPNDHDHVFVIARIARWIAPGVIGLAFLQMTERDQHRLKMFCVRSLMERGYRNLPAREGRRS